jgi:hypothetical protein
MHGLYIAASSVRDKSLRWWSAQRRIVPLMRFSAFGLAAGPGVSATLTTMVFGHSRLRWLEISS